MARFAVDPTRPETSEFYKLTLAGMLDEMRSTLKTEIEFVTALVALAATTVEDLAQASERPIEEVLDEWAIRWHAYVESGQTLS